MTEPLADALRAKILHRDGLQDQVVRLLVEIDKRSEEIYRAYETLAERRDAERPGRMA